MTAASTDAVKIITDRRDNYIKENCQVFPDGHWVGTTRQQEYVSELDDIIEVLKRADAVMTTSHAAIEAAKPKGAVYSRAECIFSYCPDPKGCKAADACVSPKAEG